MPEGDTLHKLVRAMRPDLVGRPIGTLWLRDRGELTPLAGHVVQALEAVGKHWLAGLAPAGSERPTWVVHVHLGMHGRFDRYRPGERWQRPAWQAALRIETKTDVFVCFRAAVAEVLRAVDVALHPRLSRLGPDLLADEIDLGEIVKRARTREPRSTAELLLDQRVACGIGNVIKNETLFLERIHPDARVANLDDEKLASLYATARRLLKNNLGGWRRTTVRDVDADSLPKPGERRLFVYGHAGTPCPRCGARIRGARQGDEARATYWCPGCQVR